MTRETSSRPGRLWIAGTGLVVMLLCVLLPIHFRDSPAVRFSADHFYQTFENDAETAGACYDGRLVELHGISAVPQMIDGRACLVWGGRVPKTKLRDCTSPVDTVQWQTWLREQAESEQPLPGIILYLRPGESEAIAARCRGEMVTIRGRCLGARSAPLGVPSFMIVLDSCRVLPGP